jgi:hypothetical protein
MLFRICDHYYEPKQYNVNNNEEKECFICYENKNDPMIDLKKQCFYYKKCKCGGYVHKNCLDIWFETMPKCPICRNSINKNSVFESKIVHLEYIFIIYVVCKKNFKRFLQYLIVLFFFYQMAENYIQLYNYMIMLGLISCKGKAGCV